MLFRILNALMAVLFAFAAALQYNDPDPARWIGIYSAACAVSIVAAWRGTAALWTSITVGTVALAWALVVAAGAAGLGAFAHMFDAWEMRSVPIEEARETTGLLIVAFWMAVVSVRTWIPPRKAAGAG